jgi:hypothetical protein
MFANSTLAFDKLNYYSHPFTMMSRSTGWKSPFFVGNLVVVTLWTKLFYFQLSYFCESTVKNARYQVIVSVALKTAVLLVVIFIHLIEIYWGFGGPAPSVFRIIEC